MDKLSLREKVSLMAGNIDMQVVTPEAFRQIMDMMKKDDNHYNIEPYAAGGLPEYSVPPMLFADGPRGVVCGNWKTTCFPVSMARGATFSPELEEEVGHAIGKEVRAFGGNLFAGVCINLPYHPGRGRSQETYGEETFHIGSMGAALVRGVQDEDVMACIKHFAFNNMENTRFKCSVTCDQRTEQEVYLPHFRDCIDAGAAAVMSSYNRYNGVQCGHHRYLLRQVLKQEWDFDGFVMSDFCWGVKDTVEAANGGQDMEMLWTQYFGNQLIKAVEDGFVPEEYINESAPRIIRTILAFDDGHKEYGMSAVGCKAHTDLARKVAEKAITLVKNEQVLPLSRSVRKLALIGKLADTAIIGDHGSSWVRPPYVVTPKEGLIKVNPDCEILLDDGSDIGRAKKLAAEADAVVFVVGYNFDDEGEFVATESSDNYIGESIGGDRKNGLGLHADEAELLRQVGPVNPRTAAVLMGGNMIMMSDWIDSVPAVLMAYYPGMEGGTALAEILYGDVNPSGKLPFVVPVSEDDLPYVDWEAEDQYFEYYHSYTRLDKNGVRPLYPYGHGLSYTTFEISAPEVRADTDGAKVTVSVRNTGERGGEEVVQIYVGCEQSAVDRPVRQLKGFSRVAVPAGQEVSVTVRIPADKLKHYDPAHRAWVLEPAEYTFWAGSSAAPEALKAAKLRLG